MQRSMPNMPETLSYSVVVAVGITILAALFTAATGPHDLVSSVLVLAIALGIYWLIGRHPATIVTAKQAAATGAIPAADVIYVNAGATHPPPLWLDALKIGGRLVFPLTPDEGFGVMLQITRKAPNIYAANALIRVAFIPCVGEYVIPELLGGPQTQMIGRTLWDEFFSNNDWPMACAVAVTMVLLVIVPLAVFSRYQAEASARAA